MMVVLGQLDVAVVDAADDVDAAVARHPVQPWTKGDLALVGEQGAVGGREDVLHDILGVIARTAEEPARVGQQPTPVAVVHRDERRVVARTQQSHQLLIRDVTAERDQRRHPPSLRSAAPAVQDPALDPALRAHRHSANIFAVASRPSASRPVPRTRTLRLPG